MPLNDCQLVDVLIAVPSNSHWGKIQDKPDHMTSLSTHTHTNITAVPKVDGLSKATFAKVLGSNWGHFLES